MRKLTVGPCGRGRWATWVKLACGEIPEAAPAAMVPASTCSRTRDRREWCPQYAYAPVPLLSLSGSAFR